MVDVNNIQGLEFMEDDYSGFDDKPLEELCPLFDDEGTSVNAKDTILSKPKH
jgi:hypothetical protein